MFLYAFHNGHPLLQSFDSQEKLSTEQSSVFATGSNSSKFALISLKADSKGFGFNIVGGKDSPHIPGHSGIFVSIIKQDGPAHDDGRLSVGDMILSVSAIERSSII
ncbi:hypothetical protein OESDEN_09948 [Oesophagostomum dentatum]|uniref:PDZ domain-containing protein n=1 Tax=Oesophagostomum dentatum TaxID=61180 RepID=A0A0B1T4B0_OESDE|nr:hypothetical protein OESDEN_09948 [Oesophagostomum dentatum]